MTTFPVHRIQIFPCEDNRYAVGRSETWQHVLDRSFPSLEEAQEYIYNQTIIHVPEFTNLAHGLTGEDRLKFAEAFCFSDERYLKYRQFFLGPPPFSALKKTLRAEGVTVQ